MTPGRGALLVDLPARLQRRLAHLPRPCTSSAWLHAQSPIINTEQKEWLDYYSMTEAFASSGLGRADACRVACLAAAEATDAIRPDGRAALRGEMSRPGAPVALADHVHAIQQQQPRLGAAPLGHRWVCRGLRNPARVAAKPTLPIKRPSSRDPVVCATNDVPA